MISVSVLLLLFLSYILNNDSMLVTAADLTAAVIADSSNPNGQTYKMNINLQMTP